jgi:hypothetical protein
VTARVPPAARSSTQSFVVSVSVPNEVPQLAWTGDKVAVVGETLSFTVRASDLEQNPLSFASTPCRPARRSARRPSTAPRLFTWTPTATDIGAHALTLRVADDGNDGHGPVGTDAQDPAHRRPRANQAPVLQPVGDYTLSKATPWCCPWRRSTPTAIR